MLTRKLPGGAVEWPNYGNDPGAQRYSTLNQINRDNVSRLKVSWTFHTGDVSNGENTRMKTGFENTPIVIDGAMYISTPFCRVIAIDPTTGDQSGVSIRISPRTKFTPRDSSTVALLAGWILEPNRTLMCRRRIYIGTIDARLIAIDAATGKLCTDFGAGGQINLKAGVKNIEQIGYYGEYEETSAPAIIDDMVIVGSAIGDNRALDEPLGTVRAFDTRTGALRWSWNAIPQSAARSSVERVEARGCAAHRRRQCVGADFGRSAKRSGVRADRQREP